LEREAKSHVLNHSNIVQLYAIVFELSHYGIIMEYVHHGDLKDFIFQYKVSTNTTTIAITKRILTCHMSATSDESHAWEVVGLLRTWAMKIETEGCGSIIAKNKYKF